MIPRLYDESILENPEAYADPVFNGYGFFDTVSKCQVNETVNKEYTLALTISDKDKLASIVKPNMLIKVKANPYDDPQLFEIYSVSESKGDISISANHISYLFENDIICRTRLYEETGDFRYLSNPTVLPSATVADVIDNLLDRDAGERYAYFSASDEPRRRFNFTSDIESTHDYKFYEYIGRTVGELMKGTEGSLLDIYGGEYQYDNFNIYLKRHRGRSYEETGKVIRYGANLGDYKKSMSSDNVYTHVCCWARVKNAAAEEERKIVGSPIKLINSPSTMFEKVKLIEVTEQLRADWHHVRTATTGRYENTTAAPPTTEPTVDYGPTYNGHDRIWAFCTDYAETLSRSNAKPLSNIEVSLTVNAVAELQSLQDLRLCDEVSVVLKDNTRIDGIKCTSTTYDCINEKYVKLGFGSKTLSLTDFILKQRR